MDELARAYATLELSAGSSREEVRRRYKALVRKWHPDRFTGDPQGQAEAAVRMRAINDAFRSVAAHRLARQPEAPVSAARPGARASEFGRRLTREEIDRMVESMRNEGPLDWLLEDEPVSGPGAYTVGWPLIATFLAMAFAGLSVGLARALGLSDRTLPWLMAGVWAVSFAVLLRVPPKPYK